MAVPITDVETVRFATDGIELAAHLHHPIGGHATTGRLPAVLLTGPFTGVKEQVTGLYARRIAAAGFLAMAIDHRGFGASGGRRGHEDSQGKLADLRAAVGLLSARPDVQTDRIGLVGVCLGGGYAVRAAATDPRVRVVAGIAGGYNSPARFAAGMGVESYRTALASSLERYDEMMPAVAPNNGEAVMSGEEPWSYYGARRSAGGTWNNQVTRGSLHSLLTFDALGAAELLGATPLLVVHGRADAYCSPDLAAEVHDRTPGSKRLEWLDTDRHVDLYDVEPWTVLAADATIAHLREHL